MMRFNKIFLLAILSLFAFNAALTQTVKHIKLYPMVDFVAIEFEVDGLKKHQEISGVEYYASWDGGVIFTGPLKEVYGDFGPGSRNGKYQISWSILKETPVIHENVIFEIKLNVDENNKDFMISLIGNTTTPFGIRIGQLGRIGWYTEFRASLMALEQPGYTYENGIVIDYNKHGYYQFNDKKGLSAWSAIGGVTIQATHNLYFNVGAGYGVENYLYGIDEYSYETESKTGSAWAKDAAYSNSGFELDAGIILKFNKFIISGGATTINFKTINWLGGIGVAF